MATTPGQVSKRVLVAGCGALGAKIALGLTGTHEVFGLRRTPSRIPAPVIPIGADLMDKHALAAAVPDNLNAVVYCLTPDNYSEEGYRKAYVEGLNNLLEAVAGQPIERIIFISSTSVYDQDDDSWVDETSVTNPAKASGQQILLGESSLLDSGFDGTVVRFSGIYGRSRPRFLESISEGELNPESPGPYSNRIHEEDAVAVVPHLLERQFAGLSLDDCYVASDCDPIRLDEAIAWVREQIPCKPPQADARTGGRAGSKRCRNDRLLATGFQFRYPDFRSGYREMINDWKQQGPG